jgi:purine-binding chemotaxis protein CheW
MGIMVDSVSEVMSIKAAELEPPPSFGAAVTSEYILGMAKSEQGVKILLNIDRVLSSNEFTHLDSVSQSS